MSVEDELKKERVKLLERVRAIDKALVSLLGETQTMQWTDRSLSCIRNNNRIMLSAEILSCLFWDDPQLNNPKTRNNYMTGLSIALKNLVENGVLKKENRPGIKGFYYGFPEWFDENNKVRKDYDINEIVIA